MFFIIIDPLVTLTTAPTTTTTTAATGGQGPCLNGGIFVFGSCHCPSGYTGALCSVRNGKYFFLIKIRKLFISFFLKILIYVIELSV